MTTTWCVVYREGMTIQVKQTDCRTGWQVWRDGKLYLTVRRREEADRIAAEIHAGR